MAEETEKITYEIVVDDSQATGAADNLSKGLGKVSDSADKAKASTVSLSDGLNKIVPGLGGVVTGFQGMVKGALAFIATPIGAVVASLGLAIGALTKYFKGSEEGQDRLAKVTAVLGVAFESVMQIVEALGKVVFDTIEFIASGFKNVIDFFSPQLGAMLDAAISTGSKIAELQDSIDARENELIVKRAETNKKVAELRSEAITKEGAEKKALISQAIKLEEELSAAETKQVADKKILLEKEIAASGDATEEQKKQYAELSAAKIDAETAATANTLRLQKEVEGLDKEHRETLLKQKQEADKKEQEYIDESVKAEKENRDAFLKEAEELEDLKRENEAARYQAELDIRLEDTKIHNEEMAASSQREFDNEKKLTEARKGLTAQKIGLLTQIGFAVLQFASKSKELAIASLIVEKGKAISEIISNTGIANAKAVAISPLTFGMPWVAINSISAGLSIASAITAAATAISGFAGGGISGTRINSGMGRAITRANGDNILATIKSGEVILNERQQSALGGDSTFARIGVPGFAFGGVTPFATAGISNQLNSERIFQQMIEVMQATSQKVMVIEDFESLQNSRDETSLRATV